MLCLYSNQRFACNFARNLRFFSHKIHISEAYGVVIFFLTFRSHGLARPDLSCQSFFFVFFYIILIATTGYDFSCERFFLAAIQIVLKCFLPCRLEPLETYIIYIPSTFLTRFSLFHFRFAFTSLSNIEFWIINAECYLNSVPVPHQDFSAAFNLIGPFNFGWFQAIILLIRRKHWFKIRNRIRCQISHLLGKGVVTCEWI